MTPEFSLLVNPIIRRTIDLVDRVRVGSADLKEARGDLKSLLDQADRQAAASGSRVREDEWTLSKRVLVFWLDEVLTVANPQWQSITLEWELYASRDRAWRFYYDWETEAKRSSTPNVAELWYLCLVLGFEGDIANAFSEHLNTPIPIGISTDDFRRQWAGDLARQIVPLESRALEKIPLQGTIEPLAWDARLWDGVRWAAVLLVITLVLYFIPR